MALEDLKAGEQISVYGGAYFGYADVVDDESVPYNWLQVWENIVDPYHVYVLHSTFSTVQFAEGFKVFPKVDFEAVERGVIYHALSSRPAKPIVFSWAPAYDHELTIWETTCGISVLYKSRYPADSAPKRTDGKD